MKPFPVLLALIFFVGLSDAEGTDLNLDVERSYPTPLSNSSLFPLLILSLARQKHTPDTTKSIRNEYDYIVVGAGNAGSTVAARLSEFPCVSVLLLEAGGPAPRINEVPGIGASFWYTDLDWQYLTAPQKYTGRALVNRQITWPSGKALGGCSILNDGLHVRGIRKNYDDWAAMGATGWSYMEVLPYFKKLENNTDPEYLANGFHGSKGPITVMKPRYYGPIKEPILQAAQSLGYKIVDPNAGRQTGFYDLQGNYRDSQRCSTAKAYLVPAENRTNFDILPNAFVKKVVIKNKRATGVIFSYGNRDYEVQAKQEVIMSAGTINTAQLLMLSGIGPREELEKFNIPVHANLPVGKNLQDHAGATVFYKMDPRIPTFSDKVTDDRNIMRYIRDRTGILASALGDSLMAFLYNDVANPIIDYPNYELYFSEDMADVASAWNLKPEVYDQVFKPYEDLPLLTCGVSQLRPRSRGTVTLRSANPYDEPVIDPNYLANSEDVEDFVQGMKTCKRILSHPYLRKVGALPLKITLPGCEQFAQDEDQYNRCHVRQVLYTFSHQCGTAKMGDPRDPSTVVDPKLRVKNIEGLRVVDNSIMPIIISGNTGVPAIMIGEKAADIIKESILEAWGSPELYKNIEKYH